MEWVNFFGKRMGKWFLWKSERLGKIKNQPLTKLTFYDILKPQGTKDGDLRYNGYYKLRL